MTARSVSSSPLKRSEGDAVAGRRPSRTASPAPHEVGLGRGGAGEHHRECDGRPDDPCPAPHPLPPGWLVYPRRASCRAGGPPSTAEASECGLQRLPADRGADLDELARGLDRGADELDARGRRAVLLVARRSEAGGREVGRDGGDLGARLGGRLARGGRRPSSPVRPSSRAACARRASWGASRLALRRCGRVRGRLESTSGASSSAAIAEHSCRSARARLKDCHISPENRE